YEGKEVLHFIIHDVTARKQAEQKLQLLKHAVEQNPVAIVITNSEGLIEYVNPEFTSMTGYRFEEVEGKYPRLLKSGHQLKPFYEELWNTISSGVNWEGEFLNRKKNGELYWQESSISPILDESGTITHFVAVMEDVTDKKKMIEDLVHAKEKAEESDRLKSAFLANMSHEIRTPMNGIIGFTDLLKEQKLTGKEKIKYINIIKKSGERMLNTINDLIEISQIESGTMEIEMTDLNINDQMDSFYYQYMPEAASKGLTLTCHKDFRDADALIESDGKKLNAIFSNLIKNAIKYTSNGSIEFGYKKRNNMLEFFVNDTGIGIDSKRQKMVFDRFVQADMSLTKPYEGAGLGLSIAKAYVDMLGGDIWLESQPDVGSKFYFTIPYIGKSMQVQEKITLVNEARENDLLKNLTFLVAEDDAVGQLYLSELLSDSCKKVFYASDGYEALKLFEETREKIDIILMDIKMPGMNGYQTTKRIKEINNQVFIIAQTAYALSGDREKAIDSGCDYYLAKPFSKAQLLEAVKNYYC
ncbi:MAG: PAS domain S-box protein, partial [Mariniphaga sp.]